MKRCSSFHAALAVAFPIGLALTAFAVVVFCMVASFER